MPPPIKTVRTKKYLLPLSWIYGLVVFLRNKCFDWNILKRRSYDIPIICVGNITVGGTGKTPHVEYLIKLLGDSYNVAVLSRGYKRKSKGFVLATENSTSKQLGDEPFQIKNKYPKITVAVDGKRTRGIDKLLELPLEQRPQVILLDDAFQHRYVNPSYTILLTDYNRLISQDSLLPAGRLREPAHYSEYANSIIVTKCPGDLSPLDKRITSKELHLYPYQDLLYTNFKYGDLIPVFDESIKDSLLLKQIKKYDVLLVTGIANPKGLYKKIRRLSANCCLQAYPDHHNFRTQDIQKIEEAFAAIKNSNRLIIVTEKDAARLKFMINIPYEVKKHIYYIPIEVNFLDIEEKSIFDNKIIEHVREYKRNSDLH